jgi:hypothetical protein
MHPAVYPYPTDGWITCPVQACTCRSSWSVEDDARPLFEASRREFFVKVAQGGPLPEGIGMDLWYYQLREQQWRAHEERDPDRSSWLRELDALYLFGTIGIEAILRGDSEVWVLSDEHWDDPAAPDPRWRPADEHERTASLVIASERMPELRSLLPSRPTNATSCSRCSGTGWLDGKVICPDCDGLGWIPA